MKCVPVYVNADGNSCLKDWSNDDLMAGFMIAEHEGDDLFYIAIMSEVERRQLVIVDARPPKRHASIQ